MSAVTVVADLAYGDHARHRFDIYRPAQDQASPVVVYLHGGGWQQGDKSADAERCRLVAEHGVAVASANYRLVPEVTYPEPIRDARAAVAWLRKNGASLGLRTDRIGIWGASAGGYLASMAGLAGAVVGLDDGEADPAISGVSAVVSWFAPSDIRSNSSRSWLEKLVLGAPLEAALFDVDDPAADPRAESASPRALAHAGAPPFLLAHGDRDRVVPHHESADLHDALSRAGASSTFLTLGGAGHEDARFNEPAHLAMTAAFLLQHLTSEPNETRPA